MEDLTEREKWVLGYLRTNNDSFWHSPTDVGRAYGLFVLCGKGHHSATGSPILKALVKKGYAERNSKGHYRALPTNE